MLLFQTSNKHKFEEAKKILTQYGIKIKRVPLGYEEIQADRLEEVVVSALARISKEGVFIEDAGLFIDSLKGFPGVYSSYAQRIIGNQGVLKLMDSITNRKAEFVSVLGLRHGREVKIFKGVVRGSISLGPKGSMGFGYDPIFIPEGYEKTFAEDTGLKNETSHRRKALEKLSRYMKRRT